MEMDHIVVFLDRDHPTVSNLKSTGLIENYRRAHPGQGTVNACYCFDNLYLEFLSIFSFEEAAAPSVRRMQLPERSAWQDRGGCPFGIGWRADADDSIETWSFHPPYLPDPLSISLATDSDNLDQPLMFTFPGLQAPTEWPPQRQAGLQHAAGFGAVAGVKLCLPRGVQPGKALQTLAANTGLELETGRGGLYAMVFHLADTAGNVVASLSLPDCTLVRVA
jgi:hypothetical protein